MAMTVEGFKPSQFQGVPRLWRVRRPDAESAGHYGSALDHYRQEHKSSDELPSNSETVEPGLTDEKLKGFVGGEQDMNYAEELHQTNVLSLLDQDFIDVIIHCQISYICFILIWF
uniref:Uncharacterized protein n=1 Tax=Oryza meridionalis TaxID=40149 RepID=A0A0E0E9C3_9ORYZ